MMAGLFSDLLYGRKLPTDAWKRGRMTVLFKKGDAEFPQNYRPLSIVPVMAKVFSKILLMCIQDDIEKGLPEEQFGF